MDSQNVHCKLSDLPLDDLKDDNPSAPELFNPWQLHYVPHGACYTGQKCIDWLLHKLPKNWCSIFRKSPARHNDYLQANNFHELRERRNSDYLFPLKFCEYLWLENSKVVNKIIEIWGNLRKHFKYLQPQKTLTKYEDIQIRKILGLGITQAILHFSLIIINDLEPLLVLF